jgi:hypothetical protein
MRPCGVIENVKRAAGKMIIQERNVVMLTQVWKAEEDPKHPIRSDEYRNKEGLL